MPPSGSFNFLTFSGGIYDNSAGGGKNGVSQQPAAWYCVS
jgi:hypothetical protein